MLITQDRADIYKKMGYKEIVTGKICDFCGARLPVTHESQKCGYERCPTIYDTCEECAVDRKRSRSISNRDCYRVGQRNYFISDYFFCFHQHPRETKTIKIFGEPPTNYKHGCCSCEGKEKHVCAKYEDEYEDGTVTTIKDCYDSDGNECSREDARCIGDCDRDDEWCSFTNNPKNIKEYIESRENYAEFNEALKKVDMTMIQSLKLKWNRKQSVLEITVFDDANDSWIGGQMGGNGKYGFYETVKINKFDDGNEKYSQYPNKWKIMGSMFGCGKLKLRNCHNGDIVIDSISAWKTSNLEED